MEQVEAKAAELWAGFTENEQAGVRFGLFPAHAMKRAEQEGYDGRLLSLAMMDVASKNGGMRA